MAKKKDEFSKDGIDDDDFDLDQLDNMLDDESDLDYDDPFDSPGGARKPTKGFNPKEIIKDAAGAETAGAIARKVGDEFDSVGKTYNTTIDTLSDIDRYKNDVLKDIAPTLNRSKRVARMYLPRVEKLLPKRMYAKLQELTTPEEDSRRLSEDQVRDETIGANLAAVFEAQETSQRERYVKDKTDEFINQRVGASRHAESTSVMFQIRNVLKANQLFFEGTFRRYLMKSLELKYRHLFLTKDLLEQSKLQVDILDSKLKAISHNTALPDVVKRHKSEEVAQMMRERLYGKAMTSVGEWTSKFRENLMKNVKEKVFQQFSSAFNDIVGAATEGAETAEEMRVMDEEMGMGSNKSPLAKLTTTVLKKLLVDTGFVALKAGVGQQRFKDFDSTIKEVSEQVPYRLKEFADSQEGLLGDMLRAIVPTLDRERGVIENVFDTQGDQEVPFDVIARKSLVEIIPGFLSKIHRQTELLNQSVGFQIEHTLPHRHVAAFKKLSRPEELVFDRKSEDFIRVSEFKTKALEELFGTREGRTAEVENIVAEIYAGYSRRGGDDDEFQAILPDIVKFITNVTKHAEIVHPKRILKYLNGGDLEDHEQEYLDWVLKDIPEESRKRLAQLLVQTFFKDTTPEKETVDKDVTQGIGPLLRRLAAERDKYTEKLADINVYGGKRYLDELIAIQSDEQVSPEIERLKASYLQRYGKKFTKDPKLQAKFVEEAKKIKDRSGLKHDKVRQIQSDVDHGALFTEAKQRSESISREHALREAGREALSKTNALDRVKGAVGEEIKTKVAPFKKAYQTVVPQSIRTKIETLDPLGKLRGKFTEGKEHLDKSGFTEQFNQARTSATESANNLKDEALARTTGVRGKLRKVKDRVFGELFTAAYKHGIPTSYPEFVKKAREFAETKGLELNDDLLTRVWGMVQKAKKTDIHTPVKPSDADDISDDLDVPTRDSVQVSGPGVYYQGAEKELHIPLNKDLDGVKKRIEEVLEAFDTTKSKVKKRAKFAVGELQTEAYRRGLPSNKDELKKYVAQKEEELGLLESYKTAKEKVEAKIAEVKLPGSTAELKQRIKRSSEHLIAEAQYLAYYHGLEDQYRTTKAYLETKATAFQARFDQAKQYLSSEQFREDMGDTWDTVFDPEKRKAALEQAATKGNQLFRGAKRQAELAKENLEYLRYHHDVDARAKEVKDQVFGYLGDLKDRAKEAVMSSASKLKDQTQPLTSEAAKIISTIASTTAQQFQKQGYTPRQAKEGEDPLQASVQNIEQMLSDHFTQSQDLESTKLHILNQLLMVSSRGEILKHGDPASKRKLPLWSRSVQVPTNLGGRLARGAKAGMNAYFRAAGTFYKGLADTGRKYIPKMVTGAAKVAKGGLKVGGDLLPKVGGMYAKILKGYANVGERVAKGLFGIGDKGVNKIKELFTEKNRFVDVYRKNEVDTSKPLMKGIDIKDGKYIYKDGEPVKDSFSIKGPVFDKATQQIIVSSADLKHGLVDSKNEELTDKMSLAGLGFDLGKKAIATYGKFLKGAAEVGMDATGRAFSAVTGLFGLGKSGKGGVADKETIQELVTTRLEKIIELLEPMNEHYVSQMVRAGSYEDYMRKKELQQEKKRAQVEAKEQAASKGRGTRTGLLGMLGLGGSRGADGQAGSESTGIVKGAAGLYGVQKASQAAKWGWGKAKGLFGRGGAQAASQTAARTATTQAGKTIAKRGMMRVGAQVGLRVLGYGAAAIAGAFALPAIGTALAIAGIASTAYMVGSVAYDWAKSKDDQRRAALTGLRNAAYKVPNEHMQVMVEYEQVLDEAFTKSKPLSDAKVKEFITKFGLDPKEPAHYKYYRHWFETRFAPIFQATRQIYKEQYGVTVKNQHKLTDEQIEEYKQSLEESPEYEQLKNTMFSFNPTAALRWAGRQPDEAKEAPQLESHATATQKALAETEQQFMHRKPIQERIQQLRSGAPRSLGIQSPQPSHDDSTIEGAEAAGAVFAKGRPRSYEVSAYTMSEDETNAQPGTTANLEGPYPGKTVAVSRDLWKELKGKNIWIEGVGIRRVNDTMNARYRNTLDLVMEDKATARKWGRQQREIRVLDNTLIGKLPSRDPAEVFAVAAGRRPDQVKPHEIATGEYARVPESSMFQRVAQQIKSSSSTSSPAVQAIGHRTTQVQPETKHDPEMTKQTSLITEQNSLLSQIAQLLTGISRNTEHGEEDNLPDKPLLSKFDELIETIKVGQGGSNLTQAETNVKTPPAPRARDIRQVQFRDGGISVRKAQFQAG